MSEIIDQFYTPLLIEHGFIRDPDNQQYGALGDCWKLSPEVGEGTYWTYGQKDLYEKQALLRDTLSQSAAIGHCGPPLPWQVQAGRRFLFLPVLRLRPSAP